MDAILAYRGHQPVTRAEFVGQVLALAEQLPQTSRLLNLCRDRYWFAVSLFAGIVRGIPNLLPQSLAPDALAGWLQEFPDLIGLEDRESSPRPFRTLSLSDPLKPKAVTAMPWVDGDQPILSVYTSGSTGRPRRHDKTFGQMQCNARAESQRLEELVEGPWSVLGTVPFQHMYGLESTVFLPLLGQGRLTSRLPFFPADVANAVAELPAPRVLFSTPFHLRKLIDSGIDFPPLGGVVSATAPLSEELARAVEQRLGTRMIEIFGSTETGQIATREPTREAPWTLYPGIELHWDQGHAVVSGGHLAGPQTLNDGVEPLEGARFLLQGRHSDQVNLAGKRHSLAALNQILNRIPGVQDGIFVIPGVEDEHQVARLAAFVVAPDLTAEGLLDALRSHLDPVFLPRPVVFVETLARDLNGKIAAATVDRLMARYLR